jgi:hypothetical protein
MTTPPLNRDFLQSYRGYLWALAQAQRDPQLKRQLDAMMKKELLTSLVAYNFVIQFRRQAAKLANVAPRRLALPESGIRSKVFF